jgi:hypothetical protein
MAGLVPAICVFKGNAAEVCGAIPERRSARSRNLAPDNIGIPGSLLRGAPNDKSQRS